MHKKYLRMKLYPYYTNLQFTGISPTIIHYHIDHFSLIPWLFFELSLGQLETLLLPSSVHYSVTCKSVS